MRSHKEKRATVKSAAQQMSEAPSYKHLPIAHSSNNFNQSLKSSAEQNGEVANHSTSHNNSLNNNNNSGVNVPIGSVRKKKKKRKLPRFPNRPESLVTFESMPLRIRQLEEYLYNLLNISLYRNHHETVGQHLHF